jgi:hypothetical protein
MFSNLALRLIFYFTFFEQDRPLLDFARLSDDYRAKCGTAPSAGLESAKAAIPPQEISFTVFQILWEKLCLEYIM